MTRSRRGGRGGWKEVENEKEGRRRFARRRSRNQSLLQLTESSNQALTIQERCVLLPDLVLLVHEALLDLVCFLVLRVFERRENEGRELSSSTLKLPSSFDSIFLFRFSCFAALSATEGEKGLGPLPLTPIAHARSEEKQARGTSEDREKAAESAGDFQNNVV